MNVPAAYFCLKGLSNPTVSIAEGGYEVRSSSDAGPAALFSVTVIASAFDALGRMCVSQCSIMAIGNQHAISKDPMPSGPLIGCLQCHADRDDVSVRLEDTMSGIGILSRSDRSSAGGWSELPGDAGVGAASLIKLLNDASSAVDHDPGSARSCIVQVLAHLQSGGLSDGVQPALPPRRGGLAPWQENRVKSYIEANLDQPIRIAELAVACRLSGRYFATAFRQSFGVPPKAFVLLQRVERAQMLMSSTSQALADVALACGFCDQAHFCRGFRRITGRTPKAWRRHVVPTTVNRPTQFIGQPTRIAAGAMI